MFNCLEKTLSLETQASKKVLYTLLDRAEKAKPPTKVMRSLRAQTFDWGKLSKLEEKCNAYFETTDVTKKDAIAQLSFQDDYFRSFNHILYSA